MARCLTWWICPLGKDIHKRSQSFIGGVHGNYHWSVWAKLNWIVAFCGC